jgi:hypothetical protein
MWNMQGLNRQEIEDYVIDLYHNQKKTFREIQKIVRKSPRDLRIILDKKLGRDPTEDLREEGSGLREWLVRDF